LLSAKNGDLNVDDTQCHPLSLNNFSNIATYNAKTLKSQMRVNELVYFCFQHQISILAIQEHSIYFDSTEEPVRTMFLGGWRFIYSSASAKGCGGVGFIISAFAYHKLDGFKLINNRILRLQFSYSKKLKSFFYSVYSPTAEADEDIVASFYNDLSDDLHEIGRGQFPFLLGDFNAILTVASGHAKFSPSLNSNKNSVLFEDFLKEHSLVAANTQFQKKPYQLVTFCGPNNRRVCLDFILVRDNRYLLFLILILKLLLLVLLIINC
jgi:exonuclease III